MDQRENRLETNRHAKGVRKKGKNCNITPLISVEHLLSQLNDLVPMCLPHSQ
jgi:hypothetical protein